ncbi:8979_t:CDS:2 [Paraglomus brasilianum]|uniref:Mitochondrial import inner membrane translocase subunit n=1 Tax=Paraglomus brasilianum TaxID=144538 RepID=A0A9N9FAN4_9GLOM|nr:8979_t:CDS:2 [Paraglomus brasilianum]
MAFFPFGGSAANQTVNPQNVAIVEQEMEMITDTYHRIVDSCYKKCIPPKYIEPELNKGESVCIDRCVAKFWDVYTKISESVAKKGQQQQAAGGGFGMM